MSSILSRELISILQEKPDYEVIIQVTTGHVVQPGTSIAYINGVEVDEKHREFRLLN